MATAVEVDAIGEVDAVIDTVGGTLLAQLSTAVRPEGRVILVGAASGERALLDTAALIARRVDLLSVKIPTPVGDDLSHLLALIADGRLDVAVTDGGDWAGLVRRGASDIAHHGKVVYRVTRT